MKHERTYKRVLSTHASWPDAVEAHDLVRAKNPRGTYDLADVQRGHENPPIRTVNPWAVVER